MRRCSTTAVYIATALMLAATLPGTFAQSPKSGGCAPLSIGPLPAVPGGNAALNAAQPGPGPSTTPVTCWTGVIGQPLPPAAVMALDDAVYTADDHGNVIAFDAASGTERWRYGLAGYDGYGQVLGIAPGVGLVYAAAQDGLRALDVADGSRAWRYRVRSEGPLQGTHGFFWPIAVAESVYGVTQITGVDESMTTHRAVVAVDSATGDERWSTPLPDERFVGAPTSDGSLVILAAGDDGLSALDAKTGVTVWSVPSAYPATATAIVDGVAYVGLDGGTVMSLLTRDGSEVWRSTMESGLVAGVTVVGDTVYVNGGPMLYALDAASGRERWRFSIEEASGVVPAVTADTVYVGSGDYDVVKIAALDARTGAPRWQLATETYGTVLGTVANGGRLFVVASGNTGDPALVALGDPAV